MDVSRLWRWTGERRGQINIPRWLPIATAVPLMLMVATVGLHAFAILKHSTAWRRHTAEVIRTADLFQDNLLNIQRGLRGYVTIGDPNSLVSFQNSTNLEGEYFNQLAGLTHDNPEQQRRLKELGVAMQNVFSYCQHMLAIFSHGGTSEAVNADVTGAENRAVFGKATDILNTFSVTEEKLLDARDAAEQANYRNAEQLVFAGGAVAALLLMLANFVAGRELAFRHRAEKQLSRALAMQKAISESADYGIVTTNPDGVVQTFNPAAEKILGYPAKEIIGKATPMLWRDPQEIAERAQKLSAKLGMPVRPSFDAIAKKVQFDEIDEGEWTFIRKDGKRFIASLVVSALSNEIGNFIGFIGIFRDISFRKNLEAEREKLIVELKDALAQVKTLSGLIPICSWCKNVRNDNGYWQTVEQYVKSHTEATFTHGMCPECQEKFKSDIAQANGGKLVV